MLTSCYDYEIIPLLIELRDIMNREEQITYHWNDLMVHCETKESFNEEEFERIYDEIVAKINEMEN